MRSILLTDPGIVPRTGAPLPRPHVRGYELRAPILTEGGGLSLTPNALKVLDLLGIYDHIKDEGYQFDKIVIKTEKNIKSRNTS